MGRPSGRRTASDERWYRTSWGVGLISAIATVLAALIGLVGVQLSRGSANTPPISTSGASPTTVINPATTSGIASSSAALQLVARYNWTTDSIMWSLPKPLSPGDGRSIESAALGDPGAGKALEKLLESRGGVRIAADDTQQSEEHSQLRLIVTGQHDAPVIITGIRARILKRDQPLSGTVVYGPPQGVGVDIQIGMDLDAVSPVARMIDAGGRLGSPYFAGKHVSVKRGERVVFSIRAFTDACYCEWELVVDADVDGKQQAFLVKDGVRPFRTTAFAKSYQDNYELDFDKGQFVQQPPGQRFSGDFNGG